MSKSSDIIMAQWKLMQENYKMSYDAFVKWWNNMHKTPPQQFGAYIMNTNEFKRTRSKKHRYIHNKNRE